MRIKSAVGKDVYFEVWKTQLNKVKTLWLDGVLQTQEYIHFFFEFKQGRTNQVEVLTIERLSPYRLIEEQYAVGCISKYLHSKVNKPIRRRKKLMTRTWKLWGTSFIKEVDRNHALSGYAKKRDKNICQYMVITEDEYIEFILRRPPVWTSYKNIKTEKLIAQYAIKNSLEE